MKLTRSRWLILLAILAAVGLFAAFGMKGTDRPQYFTAKADRGDIRQVVEATGTINAVITVQVGSQVSGMIDRLYVDFNSHVKTGQVVARIEQSLFKGALLQAQADLQTAKANLATAKATLEKDKAMAIQTAADYQRISGLTKEGVMSPQQLDLARANADSAKAAVSASEAQVKQAEAQVAQRAATVDVAQINLDHTVIRAPIDGTVVARNVDVGQTVAASLQAPTLFTIAQDLTKMQVYAKTDESDVGMIRPGQVATFKVDAFPRDTFTGKVSQVRMNATTVQNVVTYDTIIDFDNPQLKLFPGMTAYVTLPVAQAKDVVRVPNGALRYKPDMKPEEMRALLEQYGIREGAGSMPAAGGTGAAGQQYRTRAQGQTGGGAEPREARLDVAILWKLLPDKTLQPVQIRTGITDHTLTEVSEVLKGQLTPGDELVVGAAVAKTGSRAPGMGGPPRR
jgi:HlyD family secretion protein